MDSYPEALPDEDTETADAAGIDQAEWIADVDRYYQDDRPQERQSHEFTISDWRHLMSQRRQINLHRNQAGRELEQMLAAGKLTRRWAIIGGKWGWLYSFRK